MCWRFISQALLRLGVICTFLLVSVIPAQIISAQPLSSASNSIATCAAKWQLVPGRNTESPSNVLWDVSAISANDVWAVGVYWGLADPQALVEHWDGNAWSIQTLPFIADYSELFGVDALDANNVWAVGASTDGPIAAHRDGSTWNISTVGTPNGGGLQKVKVLSANDIWAVGAKIGHWDGTQWNLVDTPVVGNQYNILYDLDFIGPSDIWAAGYSSNYDEPTDTYTENTYILHYQGYAWNVVTSPNSNRPYNRLQGIKARASNDVWTVGYTQQNGQENGALALHWNGSAWSQVALPNLGQQGRGLYDVTSFAADDATAVGYYTDVRWLGLALAWDGSVWNQEPMVAAKKYANSFASMDGVGPQDVWAVGQVATSGASSNTLIERYAVPVAKPRAVDPANGQTLSKTRVLLDWSDVDCASSYQLALHQDTKSGTTVANPTLTKSKFKTPALQRGHTYYWQVRGCSGDTCGKWSAWNKFSIQ